MFLGRCFIRFCIVGGFILFSVYFDFIFFVIVVLIGSLFFLFSVI